MLLCSDGLTSMIDFEAVRTTLAQETHPKAAVDRLVELANAAGGEDHVTVVLIDVAADGAEVPPAPATSVSSPLPQREGTDPDVARAPPAVDTGVHRMQDVAEAKPQPARRRFPRALAWTLVLLLLLAGGIFAATRYTLANSYFVGTGEGGMVTIYRGIPDDIAGLTLKESEEQTDVAVDELPDFLRGDVEEGIRAESLDDARQKVANLKERAGDADFDKASAGGKSN